MFAKPIHYTVTDCQTGKVIGTYKTLAVAMRVADRKDLAYGAVRYIVTPIWG